MPRWTLRERRDFVVPRLTARELRWIDYQMWRLLGPSHNGKWIDAGRVGLTGFLRPMIDRADMLYSDKECPPLADVVDLPALAPHRIEPVDDRTFDALYETTKDLMTPKCLYQESMQRLARITLSDDADPDGILAWYAVSILEAYAFTPMPIHESTVLRGLQVLRRLVREPSGWVVRATPMLSTLHHKASHVNLAVSEVAVATMQALLSRDTEDEVLGIMLQECRQLSRALEKRESKLAVIVDTGKQPASSNSLVVSLPSVSPRIVKALRESRGPRAFPDFAGNSVKLEHCVPWLPTCLQMGTSADGQLVWWRGREGVYFARAQDMLGTLESLNLPAWPWKKLGTKEIQADKLLWLPHTHDFCLNAHSAAASSVLVWGTFDPTAEGGGGDVLTVKASLAQSCDYSLLDAGHVDYYGLDLAVHVGVVLRPTRSLRVDFEPSNEAVARGHWTLDGVPTLLSLPQQLNPHGKRRAPRQRRHLQASPLWTYEQDMLVARSVLTGLPRAKAYLPHMHLLRSIQNAGRTLAFAGCKRCLFSIRLDSVNYSDGGLPGEDELSIERCLILEAEDDVVTAISLACTVDGGGGSQAGLRLFVGTKHGLLLQVDCDDACVLVQQVAKYSGVVSAIQPTSFPRPAMLVCTPACLHTLWLEGE